MITTSGAGKGVSYIDPTAYSGTVSYYFEVVAKVTSGAGSVTLGYDASTGQSAFGGSTITVNVSSTTYARVRSSAFSPSGGNVYISALSGTGISVSAARIIIVQTDPVAIMNTLTQYEIGNAGVYTSTVDAPAASTYWSYDSTKYSGAISAYLEATMGNADAGTTTTMSLYYSGTNCTSPSGGIGSISSTGTSTKRIRSGDISANLVSGHTYEICARTSNGTYAAYLDNAKIIIGQTSAHGLSNMELAQQLNVYANTTNASLTSQSNLNIYEAGNWYGGTYNFSFRTTLNTSVGTDTVTAELCYQTTTACDTLLAGSTLTTASTSYSLMQSGAITPIDQKELDVGLKVTTGGDRIRSNGSWLIIDVSGMPVVTPTPTPSPIPVTVTVNFASPTTVSNFSTGLSQIDNSLRLSWGSNNNTAVSSATTLVNSAISYMNQAIFGWGADDIWPNPATSDPNNWSDLDGQMSVIANNGATPVITFADAPWWMKGQLQGDGTTKLIPDATGDWTATTYASGITDYRGITFPPGYVSPDPYSSRILDNQMSKWTRMVQDVATRYMVAPYNVRTFQVWNELKGYWNLSSNHWDYTTSAGDSSGYNAESGYTYLYNQTYAAIMAAADSLSISRSNISVGGPYPVIDTYTSTSAVGHATTETLLQNKTYGTYDQRDLDVVKYWLQNKTGAGFITVDASNTNKEGTTLTDPFTASEKFADVTSWIRSLNDTTYPGATTLPIWWAEWYDNPFTNYTDDYNNAVKAYGIEKFIKAGGAVPLSWGGSILDSDTGIWTQTNSVGGGVALPWYTSYKSFHDNFSSGTQLYSATSSDTTSLDAISSATKTILINKTASTVAATVNGNLTTINPYNVITLNLLKSFTVSLVSPSDNSWTNNASPTFSWSISSGSQSELSKYQLYVDGTLNRDNISTSATSTTPTTPLAEGSHSWYIVAVDVNSGTTQSVSTQTIKIDVTAPSTPGAPLSTSPTNSLSQSWTWTVATDTLSGVANYLYKVTDSSSNTIVDWTSTLVNSVTTSLSEGIYNFFVKAVDNTTNQGSQSSGTVTIDTTAPTISLVPINTPTSSVATITWITNKNSSSRIDYGLTNSYGSTTTETDTSPRVINHSVALSSLSACTTYQYRVRSKDITTNEGFGNNSAFTTSGCVASSQAIATSSAQITTASGGSLILQDGSSHGLTLTVPSSFANSDANFQAHQLNSATVLSATSTPDTYSLVGSYIYQLTALSDISTAIPIFTNPLTVNMSYGASDVTGLDESTLKIYRWDGAGWIALTGCMANTLAKTIACNTSNFSVFGLFGQTPTLTPNSTLTPTQSSSNSNNSNNNNSSSSSSNSTCGNQAPSSAPNLYEMDTQGTKTTLYFAPAGKPYSDYYVTFGNGSNDEQYSASFGLSNTTGAIYYTITQLSPNTVYSFKVRAGNGCAPGNWSKTMKIQTTSGKVTKKYYSSIVSYLRSTVSSIVSKVPVLNNALNKPTVIQQVAPITTQTQAPTRNTNDNTVQPAQRIYQPQAPAAPTPKKKTCILFICW